MKTNESAFPGGVNRVYTNIDEGCPTQNGLTKREYFAAKAMEGFCANPAVFAPSNRTGWALLNTTEDSLGQYCGVLADAVLAQLAATEGTK